MASNPTDDVINELQSKVNLWYAMAVFCDRSHFVFGILGILFSALSAAKFVEGVWISVFGVAATVCFGVLGFAGPQKYAARYIRAYRILDSALRELKCDIISIQQLLAEHRRAEEVLNDIEFSKIPPIPEAK